MDDHDDTETNSGEYDAPADSIDGESFEPVSKEERTWAMACHLATFSGTLIPVVPLLGNIIGPLIIWMIKKDKMPLVDDQGREAINFQISMAIYFVISGVLVFVIIGIPMLMGLGIFDVVVTIIAAIKAYEGENYRYPLCIRFLN